MRFRKSGLSIRTKNKIKALILFLIFAIVAYAVVLQKATDNKPPKQWTKQTKR